MLPVAAVGQRHGRARADPSRGQRRCGGRAVAGGGRWPTAADIAFALVVPALISTHLPAALRTSC
nr:hypothetical protein [Actinoplanes sichuanensis]